MASVRHRNRRDQNPVLLTIALNGLMFSWCVTAASSTDAAGHRLATKIRGFNPRRMARSETGCGNHRLVESVGICPFRPVTVSTCHFGSALSAPLRAVVCDDLPQWRRAILAAGRRNWRCAPEQAGYTPCWQGAPYTVITSRIERPLRQRTSPRRIRITRITEIMEVIQKRVPSTLYELPSTAILSYGSTYTALRAAATTAPTPPRGFFALWLKRSTTTRTSAWRSRRRTFRSSGDGGWW